MRALLVAALLAAGPARAAPVPDVPQTNLRYDEDWSSLSGRDAASDRWWTPAKYQPLDEDGTVYLSTGLEARTRYEGFENNNWGDPPATDDGYLWLRLMPHADFHAGPARAFVQAIAGYAVGVGAGEGPVDETGFDLLQGFADLRLPLGETASLTIRGGRELVALGSERLVGIRYGPNIPQAFDGGRAILEVKGIRIDAFALRPVAIGQGDFDDRSSNTKKLSGIYATAPLAEHMGLDLYWLDYRNRVASFAQGTGRENRQTWGLRFHGTRGSLGWNWEAMFQQGDLDGGHIRAWSATAETSYGLPDLALAPSFRLRASVASGDKDATDPRLQTFNPLFPKGKYFGELSPIGPQNIINLQPSVDVNLGSGVTLTAMAAAYWRAHRGDGIYNVPGQLLRAPGGATARYVGGQAEAVVGWQASKIMSFTFSLSCFTPGDFIRQTGRAKSIGMVGAEAMLRF